MYHAICPWFDYEMIFFKNLIKVNNVNLNPISFQTHDLKIRLAEAFTYWAPLLDIKIVPCCKSDNCETYIKL